MTQYAWPVGLAVAVVVSGVGGFFAGTLSERLAHLEAMAIETRQASLTSPAGSPQFAAPAPAVPVAAPLPFPEVPTTPVPAAVSTGLDADGVPLQAKAVLDTPELAAKLMEAVSKAVSITTAGADGKTDNPVYVFIDPRCPYCHKVGQELLGKVAVTWIPTTMLGDTENGVELVEALRREPDANKAVQAMIAGTLVPLDASADTQGAVNENAGVLYSIYAGAEDSIAVPTLLVPEPDGTVRLIRGFGDGDGAKVVAAYGG